jgi:hypothetical protein
MGSLSPQASNVDEEVQWSVIILDNRWCWKLPTARFPAGFDRHYSPAHQG